MQSFEKMRGKMGLFNTATSNIVFSFDYFNFFKNLVFSAIDVETDVLTTEEKIFLKDGLFHNRLMGLIPTNTGVTVSNLSQGTKMNRLGRCINYRVNAPYSPYNGQTISASKIVILFLGESNFNLASVVNNYDRLLSEIDATISINLDFCKTPYILGVREKREAELRNLLRKRNANAKIEDLITSNYTIETLEKLDLTTPFIIDKLREERVKVLEECFTRIGFTTNNNDKRERLTEKESVLLYNQQLSLSKIYDSSFKLINKEIKQKFNNFKIKLKYSQGGEIYAP